MSRGDIAAANARDGTWLFTRALAEPVEGMGTPCEIIGRRDYEPYDVVLVVDWLAERKAGYPGLDKFKGGALWPAEFYECGEGYAHPVGQPCNGQCVNRG